MAHGTLQILQLNVHKRREVQQSLLNDEGLKDHAVLAISKLYARTIDGSVVTVPLGHHNLDEADTNNEAGGALANPEHVMGTKRHRG
jgi:hypothetical protein